MKCIRSYRDDCGELVDRSDFDREVAAMEVCRGHPYIVQPRAHGRCDDGEAVLVMEFVGPTLRQVLRRERGGRTRRSELEVRVAMRQLLSGAKRMHDAGLMHRDLKPDNVLVDARGNLKICDLGLSQSTASPPPYSNPIGTRWYCAPEILLGSTDYDERVDAWSLGCIMAELLARKPLFRGSSDREQLGEIVDVLGVNDIKRWRGYKGAAAAGRMRAGQLSSWLLPISGRRQDAPPAAIVGGWVRGVEWTSDVQPGEEDDGGASTPAPVVQGGRQCQPATSPGEAESCERKVPEILPRQEVEGEAGGGTGGTGRWAVHRERPRTAPGKAPRVCLRRRARLS
uniref:[RNA-polymerase]-subunit kinase n=1 Tax=Oryza sativa subsp. japonica TaxID=39947 RepID=Q2QSE2_ORYSJ|nr:Protein kinase domain containing protein [Oryza sativa Japonica Group]